MNDEFERDESGSLTELGRDQLCNWSMRHGLIEGEEIEILS